MLHQIRKMVGITVFIIRFKLDAQAKLIRAFAHGKCHIPLAPSVGLLLDRVLYAAYNRKFGHCPDLDFRDIEVSRDTECPA